WLHEFLSRCSRTAIELCKLSGCRSRHAQSLPFSDHLADQSNLLSFGHVEAAAREQQVPDDRVTKIPLQSRNSPEPRNNSKSQLGKTETRGFVGDNHVARKSQLQASAENNSMYSRDGGQRGRIQRVHGVVNTLMKVSYSCQRS